MGTGTAGKVNDSTGDILGLAKALHGVRVCELLSAASLLHETVGHLAREEPRAERVDGDVAGAELEGQVAAEVEDGSLGGRVAVGAVAAQGADAEAGDRGGDDDARGVADGAALLQQGRELADGVEDAADVEVHDLGERLVRVLVKGRAPGGAGVGEEDVDVVGVLAHLGEQVLDAGEVRRVGGH